ncbi:MAG: hypothetical protein C5B50_20390 [Verrucomicrobia bacterium]|nr:MAG: hypothetical protein C5B50_20390 [Verrucomicrobiota bacterium]
MWANSAQPMLIKATPLAIFALAACAASSFGSVLSVAGNDTLVGNRAANLITNGSFEADGGVATNGAYWATGTTLTPTVSLTGWTASGQSQTYAIWGSDGFGGIKNSAMFPHGTNGLYFGGDIMASVSPYPVEANNGLVTFTSTPTITPKPTDAPVSLQQTVSGLNPSATYVLDFWTSGEDIGQPSMAVDGFFALDITGEPRLYFAAPSGNGPIGTSQRYQVYFNPTASTVTFKWINWGHYFGPNGMSDELVLDDVILNLLTNGPPQPLDYTCLTNLPNWTVMCPGYVPDMCALALASGCFSTNLLPGSCTQGLAPGQQFGVGTYPLSIQMQDLQSNVFNYSVNFTVLPPSPMTNLNVVCPTNKTVECGTDWSFDSPLIQSACCGVNITSSDSVISNTGCSQVIVRTWNILDGCGNAKTCSQTVTTQDTTPPGTQCGQNLVPNHSFEQFTNCPSSISMFDLASPWFTPTDGTTDLYSPCAGPSSFVYPTNPVAFTGQCYAGAHCWSVYGLNPNNTYHNYREYMEVPLLTPLAVGQAYQVSFRVCRSGKYRTAIAQIGAALTPGPLLGFGTYTNFNVVPQVENPSTNLLTSTNTWTLVQGTFVAFGGEAYLTLGNFRTDANTTYTNLSTGQLNDYSYYFFDDVSVVALCGPLTNHVVQCGQPWTFDTVTPFDNCSGNNVTSTVSTTTNGSCPKAITRTWALADQCGNTNLLTQTITIVDTNPPVLICGTGANLVPNGQFENYTFCPSGFSQLNNAAPWFTPTVATPDYLNSCATYPPASTPSNVFGYQTPFSGQGYAGAFEYSAGVIYAGAPGGYREYIEAPLLVPLTGGVTYQVSFRVSLADTFGWGISQLGAYCSVGQVFNGSTQGVLGYTPQVENPAGNPLTSTNGWMLVQGTFTAAGGEDHITLGNFRTDASTTAVPAAGTNNFAYYYIDDVTLTALCSFTNKTVQCGSAWSFDTPLALDDCSGNSLTTTILSTTTNGACPQVITRTWSIMDACSNSVLATQAVAVVNNTAPVVNCGCLQDAAIPYLTTNSCSGIVPDLSGLTNSPCISGSGCGPRHLTQSPAAGTVLGPGPHNITVGLFYCGGPTNTCIVPYNVTSPAISIKCPPDIFVFGCSNSTAIVHYTVTAIGNTGVVVCSPPSGSIFPLGTNTVTCTATNSCGGIATCVFHVVVRPVPIKFACIVKIIGVISFPPPTARVIHLPDFPGGGLGVDLADLDGTTGMLFDVGPAQKFTFSTFLDFTVPEGASFSPALPSDSTHPNGTPLLNFALHSGHWEITANRNMVDDTAATFRSIAIGTNGELFSSFTHTGVSLDTNILARLTPMDGATGAVMTVTLDCRTREMSLAFPSCVWTSDSARKGWDGCIYGNPPRASVGDPAARLILNPLTSSTPTPITTVTLLSSNLPTLAFDNPSITASGRPWNDGHLAFLHANADSRATGVEVYAVGDGGGVTSGLGQAASFQFNIAQMQDSTVQNLAQQFVIRGWPPGTTTNRPPPPVFDLRLAQNTSGTGGIDCFADFTQWGVSNVTVQLWNGTALVAQNQHVPASLASPVATLAAFPGGFSCPAIGTVSLTDTNPVIVLAGLNCSTGCSGTELRILAELSKTSVPPVAFTGFDCFLNADMDNLIYNLRTTPACSPVPLNVTADAIGIHLTWQGDGFRLQGAESVTGPWYDLGVTSPVTLPANYSLRLFRLVCD